MLRMLIADDHTIVRQRLKQLLLDGFPSAFFEVASDTDSLVSLALNSDWDIVISDLIMPGGGGLQALKKIKQAKPFLPVVIISLYPEEQYSSHVITAGADSFLNKNNADAELVSTVKKILENVSRKTA